MENKSFAGAILAAIPWEQLIDSPGFTRREFQRILDVTDKQLNYWERLQLVSPRKGGDEKFYDFRDLIALRAAKQLIEKGVSANRLRRSLVALNEKLSQVQAPLTELRILANGRDVIVEHDGARLEPISGQFVLNFDTRELRDKVRVMPERTAEDWFALALQYEADPASRAEAIDAYHRVLSANPRHVDALINLGMLSYDGGDLEKAVDCFRSAVALEEGTRWNPRASICVSLCAWTQGMRTRTTTWRSSAKNCPRARRLASIGNSMSSWIPAVRGAITRGSASPRNRSGDVGRD